MTVRGFTVPRNMKSIPFGRAPLAWRRRMLDSLEPMTTLTVWERPARVARERITAPNSGLRSRV